MRINPLDADRLGVVDGQRVRVITKRGEAEAPADITDTMMEGQVSLPHGFGMEYPDENGEHKIHGVSVNDQTLAWVPGSFELPMAARELIGSYKPDVVICLGCIIRGETSHYDHVAAESARGIARAAILNSSGRTGARYRCRIAWRLCSNGFSNND